MLKLQKVEEALLFLTIFFLPTQLGKHLWPDFSFVYSLPVDYLAPTFYLWDILVLALFIIFLIEGKHINRVAINLFYFFILTQSFSLLSSFANIGVGLVRLEQYLIVGLFGVYIASLKNSSEIKVIFLGLLSSIGFEGILAVGQFLKSATLGFWLLGERTFSISSPGIAKFDYYGREFLRPYATFPHPNVLAGFMVIGIIILNTLKTFFDDHSLEVFWKKQAKITLIVSALAVLTVLLTVSRVALISGLIFAITVATKNRYKLLLIIGVIILLPILYTRFSSLLNFDNLTFVRREELSVIAIKVWKISPLFGVGLNNFIPTASDLLLAGPSRFLQPVHDIFLLALSETGILGFTGLICLFGYPIFKNFKSISSYRYPILLLWLVIIFLSLFDHYFLTLPQGYRLLFLVWGLSMAVLE